MRILSTILAIVFDITSFVSAQDRIKDQVKKE